MDIPLDSETVALNSGFKKSIKSFADVIKINPSERLKETNLAGFSSISSMFRSSSADAFQNKDFTGFKLASRKDDRPAILLTDEEVVDLSQPLRLTLIGKFPVGRPKWDVMQSVFKNLHLKGDFRCVNLDVKHVVIYLSDFDDYIRLFEKQKMFIHGFLLKLFKWTPEFSFDAESSIVPTWILLPMLKLHLFNHSLLFSIAAIYGNPLKLDFATSYCLKPSCARVLVELDLRKQYDQELWIGTQEDGYMQQVVFQNNPGYCLHCRKIGHSDSVCFYRNPELNSVRNNERQKKFRRPENEIIGSPLCQNDSVKPVENPHPFVVDVQDPIIQQDSNQSVVEILILKKEGQDGNSRDESKDDQIQESEDNVIHSAVDDVQLLNTFGSVNETNGSSLVQCDSVKTVENIESSVVQLEDIDSNLDTVINSDVIGLQNLVVNDLEDASIGCSSFAGSNRLQITKSGTEVVDGHLNEQLNEQQSIVVDLVSNDQLGNNCLIDNQSLVVAQQSVETHQIQVHEDVGDQNLQQQMNSGKCLSPASVGEFNLQSRLKNQSNPQGQMQIDSESHIVNVTVSYQKTKEKNSWADEVEEQMILNNITLGEQISEAEDVHQINKIKEIVLSNEVDYDLGPNFSEVGKNFHLKVCSTKSLGDEVDSEGEESFYQILQDKGKHFGKENFYRSPIITRSHTKGAQQDIKSSKEEYKPDGYVSDSWFKGNFWLKS